ncbi:MAG TPA: AAA family ATPase [Polyangiaceae bacterium]|nr:AAA family ATPase [Polyangiaceae bacterium]
MRESGPPAPDAAGDEVVERRCHVTLLFSDLCDYTPMSEALDPEETDELRQSISRLAHEVIPKHGGAINQFVGDSILAVFGFPTAEEDEVRRAVDAALELHQAVSREWSAKPPKGFRIQLHSGVHAGLVFVRKGDPLAGKYELTGDTVNTASRLCTVAGRDEILVSQETLRGVEPFFDVEHRGAIKLKGKQRPMLAYRVRGRSAAETRFDASTLRGLSHFVGREAQLAALESAVSSAVGGRGNALCLVGDAGIGKTRLLDEFKRRSTAAGLTVYRGGCENYGGVAPLRPFLQIAREVLPVPKLLPVEQTYLSVERGLTAIDESLRDHLPAVLKLLSLKPWRDTSSAEEQQLAVIAATTELLLALGRARPLLLIIDDWQWADGASTQVLGRLMRVIHDKPILIVIAAREVGAEDPVLGPARKVELLPFTEDESQRAVHGLLLRQVENATALRIHQRSGGNPLFLEEICQSLPASGELELGISPAAVPVTVRGLLQMRVERLEARPQRLLALASVLGNEFPIWLLHTLSDDPDLEETLEVLKRFGFLYETEAAGTLRFKHGIAREVVYDSVRVRERRRLHGQVAHTIKTRFSGVGLVDQYEALASHYAGAHDFGEALEFAELAGDKAAVSSALDHARSQYAAALAHVDQLPEHEELTRRWLAIVPKWANACVFSPSRDQLAVLTRAVTLAEKVGDYGALCQAEYWIGWIQYALGDQERAVSHSNRALGFAERANHEPLIAQLLSNLGQSHAAAGRYDEALAYLERGIEMKRLRAGGSRKATLPVGFAYALGCRGLVYGDRGDFNAAYVQVQEALELVRDSGHAVEGSLLCLLGMIQLMQGRWQDALHTAARGRATAERVNGPYVLAICQTVSGYARWVLERSQGALEELKRAIAWLERREIGLYLGFGYAHLAHASLVANAREAASDYAARAVARAETGDPLGEALGERVLSQLHALAGDRVQALAHGELAVASAARRGSARDTALARLTLGELHRDWGEIEASRPLLVAVRGEFEQMAMNWHRAEAERLLRLA